MVGVLQELNKRKARVKTLAFLLRVGFLVANQNYSSFFSSSVLASSRPCLIALATTTKEPSMVLIGATHVIGISPNINTSKFNTIILIATQVL